MKAIKALLLLIVIWISVYGYVIKEVYPLPVKSKSVIAKRPEASFFKIDDSVLKELQESKEYSPIRKLDPSEIGKEKLFDAPDKKDFSL